MINSTREKPLLSSFLFSFNSLNLFIGLTFPFLYSFGLIEICVHLYAVTLLNQGVWKQFPNLPELYSQALCDCSTLIVTFYLIHPDQPCICIYSYIVYVLSAYHIIIYASKISILYVYLRRTSIARFRLSSQSKVLRARISACFVTAAFITPNRCICITVLVDNSTIVPFYPSTHLLRL